MGYSSANPFLSGNYAPVASEDDVVLSVEGLLPARLKGRLLRIGPNPQFPGPDYFWFNGDGMVHELSVADGAVRYRNRFVPTPKYVAERRLGRGLLPGEAASLEPSGGIANTNVLRHAGRLLALEENHGPFEISADLEGVGYRNWDGAVTAHPKIDPLTGEMTFFAYAAEGPGSTAIDIGVASADGQLRRRERFQAPYSSMIHDCFLTERHLILPVLPLTADLERAAKGEPFYAWDPEKPSLLAVIDRAEGASSVRWYDAPAGYIFHTLNAYIEHDRVIADTFVFDRAPLFPGADGTPPRNAEARLERWELKLAGSDRQVSRTRLDDRPGEFPRMDERRLGQRHRHGWFAGQHAAPGTTWFDSLRHVDLDQGRALEWVLPAGDAISEPVFVPSGPEEGEGWILAVAYRGAADISELLIFDAFAVDAGPIASAKAPRRIPFGFHGNWISDNA